MDIREAIKLFQSKYPDFLVTGYWKKPNGLVLNAKACQARRGATEPGQFVVTNDGKVYGTNPFCSDLNPTDMIKII